MSAGPKAAAVLLRQSEAWEYIGVSRRTWYRLLDTRGFPAPVSVPGLAGRRWRREDLDAWVRSLGRDRRRLPPPGQAAGESVTG